jgi:nucleotide-binding universal stress UspA family protein
MPYQNVVVGTDGSETAETAVRHASQLAKDHNARLVIVTAYEPQDDALVRRTEGVPDDIRWTLTDRAQAEEKAIHGRELAQDAGLKGVVAQAIPGSPPDVLLEAAQDFGADVIVVGSRGLTGAARFVLGSVASTVSHHAPCDVLIVHTTGPSASVT